MRRRENSRIIRKKTLYRSGTSFIFAFTFWHPAANSPPEKYKTQKAMIRGVVQNLTAKIEIKVTEEEEGALFPFSKSVLEAKAMVIFDPEGQKAELQQEDSPAKISYYDAIKLSSSIE